MDGTESVPSERSTRSQGSGYYVPSPHWQPPPPPPPSHSNDGPFPSSHSYSRRHPSSASSHSHSRQNSWRDRGGDGDHSFARSRHSCQESDTENHRDRPREERIEVQVIPQDDNWGDNTTAITSNTSETGFSMDVMNKFPSQKDFTPRERFNCVHYLGTTVAVILSLFGFLSPIAMVILPRLNIIDWSHGPSGRLLQSACAPECEGLLISFAFKLLILLLGTLAVFFRQPKATMPRMFVFRAIVLFLVFVLTFAFWLFYGVRIVREKQTGYHGIVLFADSLVDGLLFIHYLALVLLEIRQLQPQFVVRVTRSPDGDCRCYSIGLLSVQRAAVTILEHYYRDFPMYNPYLDMVGRRSGKHSLTGFKVYDVDSNEQNQSSNQERSRAVFAAAARRRDSGHNDRFYDELEYERRVRKRKARLLVAAEEAFTHIKRLQDEQGPTIPMDPMEAAQAVFPSMARALQKYLRITRQQPCYTMENVLAHLATCISYDLAPRAFIARYLTQGAVIMNEHSSGAIDRWVIVCEQNVVREVEEGTEFQLRHGDVSLLCCIRKLPHFSMTEDVRDPKNNKFVLRLNSETSV